MLGVARRRRHPHSLASLELAVEGVREAEIPLRLSTARPLARDSLRFGSNLRRTNLVSVRRHVTIGIKTYYYDGKNRCNNENPLHGTPPWLRPFGTNSIKERERSQFVLPIFYLSPTSAMI